MDSVHPWDRFVHKTTDTVSRFVFTKAELWVEHLYELFPNKIISSYIIL